ncbi:hypothetical protein LY76DRAFT_381221 [Colletotrichum caudatum]|nr:hypothetical protein LY76DRAFT_381221 [Colletotrichum caudatum]
MALTSLLISATRYYVERKNMPMIMVDEVKVMKIYSKIANVLYESAMLRDLPKVTDLTTRYLSESISRTSADDVSISTPDLWLTMLQIQDGKQAVAVLRTLVMTAKLVPEAMVHLILQLIPYLDMYLVMKRDGKAIFTLKQGVEVCLVPDQWESWCGILKTNVLVTYIKHRLLKMKPDATVAKMMNEILGENLTSKRGMEKIMGLGLYVSLSWGFGCPPDVEGTLRKLLVLSKWTTLDVSVTMWTIEPVVLTMIISGNTLDVSAAKENFSKYLDVIDPMTVTLHTTAVMSNQIMGRWAGWLVWNQLKSTNHGNPAFVNCNLSGSSIFFAVHSKVLRIVHMVFIPESVRLILAYSRTVCVRMGTTSSVATSSSTKLKFQPSLSLGMATSLTLFGDGSMQLCGSLNDIQGVCSLLYETLKTVMESEMGAFSSLMRRADLSVI